MLAFSGGRSPTCLERLYFVVHDTSGDPIQNTIAVRRARVCGRNVGSTSRRPDRTDRSARTSRAARAAGCAVAVVLVVSGCTGSPDEPSGVGDAPNDTGQSGSPAQLCLPPACGTTVPFESTVGFVGPAFGPADADADADADARVLTDSVTVSTDGDWSALGLVAGAQANPNAAAVVVAELRDARGAIVATVNTNVPVAPLRPGEPGPFRIEAPGVPTADVVDVAWSVTGGGPVAPGATRSMGVDVFWTRPAGGRPVDVEGFADGGGAGTPLVTYVGVMSTGTESVPSPAVVAAWLDGSGRVVAIASADVLEPGTAMPLGALDPGAMADAVVVLDGAVASSLAEVTPLLWAVGRP